MGKLWYIFAVFMGGAVVALNLSELIDTNPEYVAAWWKVALAGFIAVFSGVQVAR